MRPMVIATVTSAALLAGLVGIASPVAADEVRPGGVTLRPAVAGTSAAPLRLDAPGTVWETTAVGGRHTLGLARDGSVLAWGANDAGQLGNGTTTASTSPRRVDLELPAGVTVRQVHAGDDFSLVLASDGSLWTWGGNTRGQLGLGHRDPVLTPQRVPGIDGVRVVDVGGQFVVAQVGWEHVWTWGANEVGQLGDGTLVDRDIPAPIPDPPYYSAEKISAGNRHVLLMQDFYGAYGWGDNSYGQLGSNAPAYVTRPAGVNVGSPSTIGALDLFAVGDSSFVYPGDLRAFGRNDRGQLGIGTYSRSAPSTPVLAPEGSWPWESEITGSTSHVVLSHPDGTVWVWGDDQYGQLGRGAPSPRSATPVPAFEAPPGTVAAAGGGTTVVVLRDGRAVAWGRNDAGQIGDGSTTTRPAPTGVRFPADVTRVSIGGQVTGAVARGSAGRWSTGAPALAAGTYDVVVDLTDAAGAEVVRYAPAGGYRTTTTPPPDVVTDDLPVAVAGEPYAARLEARSPVPVTWSVVSGRLPDGLALDARTGALSGTGGAEGRFTVRASSAYGTTDRALVLAVAGQARLTGGPLPDAAAGRAYAATIPFAHGTAVRATVTAGALPDGLAVTRSGGTLRVAGTPAAPGTFSFALTTTDPVAPRTAQFTLTVGTSPRVVSAVPPSGVVGAPYSHTFAADGDGATFFLAAGGLPPGLSLDPATGTLSGTPTVAGRFDVVVGARNAYAQEATDVVVRVVGPGLSSPVTPAVGPVAGGNGVRVATPSPRFSEVTTTGTTTLGLTADGYVWAWGTGATDRLAERGLDVDAATPVRLAVPLEPGVKITQLVTGSGALLVASDGTIREVVADPAAPSGTRVATVALTLPAGVQLSDVVAGKSHVLALASDGTVWAWGANDLHQLGDGTTAPRTVPAQVAFPPGTTITSVSAAASASLASDAAGRVWSWGLDVARCPEPWECTLSLATPTLLETPPGLVAAQVVTSETVAAAITSDGALWTWGNDWYRQSGRWLDSGNAYGRVDMGARAGTTVEQVALSREGGIALLSDGSVRRWGRLLCPPAGGAPQCGRYDDDGVYEERPTLVDSPVAERAAAVVACLQCGLVLTKEGQVWGWGSNGSGQLGDGTRERRAEPVATRTPFTVTGVTFDGVAARITGAPENAVVSAVVPRHAAGPVDVVVTTRRPDGSPGPSVRYGGAYTYGTDPAITSAAPPAGVRGRAYTHRFTASGSTPLTYAVSAGSLPRGLRLTSEGVLSGTPTATGTSRFTLRVTSPWGSASAEYTLAVR